MTPHSIQYGQQRNTLPKGGVVHIYRRHKAKKHMTHHWLGVTVVQRCGLGAKSLQARDHSGRHHPDSGLKAVGRRGSDHQPPQSHNLIDSIKQQHAAPTRSAHTSDKPAAAALGGAIIAGREH
jgi:hypothetical protein